MAVKMNEHTDELIAWMNNDESMYRWAIDAGKGLLKRGRSCASLRDAFVRDFGSVPHVSMSKVQWSIVKDEIKEMGNE